MGDAERFTYSYREIAECLIKKQDLHEGIWGLYVQFGIGAANVPKTEAEGEKDLVPAAVIPVLRLGIQRFKEESNIAVDAAKVNPLQKSKASKPKSA